MKKSLFTAVAVTVLAACASAFAQDNSTVTQNGSGDNALVDQTAASGATSSTVTQSSDNQYADVQQAGSVNTSTVTQDTDGAYYGSAAYVTQLGTSGTSDVGQYGFNYASVKQDAGSVGETAYVRQTGYNPYAGASIYQNGMTNSGWALQTGDYNTSTVIQTGTGGGYSATDLAEVPSPGTLNAGTFGFRTGGGSEQIGNFNSSYVDQAGINGLGGNYADGDSNTQSVYQFAGTNQATAIVNTTGNANVSTLIQNSGQAFSGNIQYGGGNTIYVNQTGSSSSLIGQGSNDFVNYNNTGPQTFGASATVSQTGDGNASTVVQFDGATASVTQIAGLIANESTVTQEVGSAGSNATVDQYGSNGQSTVTESGAGEIANVTQYASATGANSTVTQSGASDNASVGQQGASEVSLVTQSGGSDLASVSQTGSGENSTVSQSGALDAAYVTQGSSGAVSLVTQSGSSNTATVHQ